MGEQILKLLTFLKLLITNGINSTSINNTDNHCRWLNCIMEGLCYEYGHTKMENYVKMENEIYIYLSKAKLFAFEIFSLVTGYSLCHQVITYI